MINSPLIPPPFPESRGIVKSLLTRSFVFPCPLSVDTSHPKSGLLHNYYDAFIFHLLNAIVSEVALSGLFCLIFISYLACRPGPEKVPPCLAVSIAVILHTAASHFCLGHGTLMLRNKQTNAPKSSMSIFFLLFV